MDIGELRDETRMTGGTIESAGRNSVVIPKTEISMKLSELDLLKLKLSQVTL